MSDLLRDNTPLQLGTTGEFDGKKFHIMGRQRMSWDLGYWNEWYLRFENGSAGWLSEAQGFYAVALENSSPIPALSTLKPEAQVAFDGRPFTVDDIKKASVSFIEGYSPSTLNSETTSVDFSGDHDAFASIDFMTGKLFVGKYVEFDGLKFGNLKSAAALDSTFKFAITCPGCGDPIDLRAGHQSVTAVCLACSSILDTSKEGAPVVDQLKKKNRLPDIPIGSKGKLKGVEWDVVGFLERVDGVYRWTEYLLFNRTQGYRWLTEFNGHWNFVTMIKQKPTLSSDDSAFGSVRRAAVYLGRTYHLYNQGSATVRSASGEFYWQVRIDEKVKMDDFVHPPYVLTAERADGEIVWSHGEYLSARVVKNAFANATLPTQIGVASNQAALFTASAHPTLRYWGALVGALIFMQFAFWIGASKTRVYSGTFNASLASHTFVSPPFELKGGEKNVEITMGAGVQNNWLEVQGELVNDLNGTAYEFEQGVEFYSGSDSDGSWTEGGRTASVNLSSVPKGAYHLNVDASGPAISAPIDVNLTVERDVITWSNFWWAVFLLSLYPLLVWWRNRSFEVERWSNSDFSPFPAHIEGSDE